MPLFEVKGDFCGKAKDILVRHQRAEDYIEISLDSEYCYNPLHNDLDAYALAYNGTSRYSRYTRLWLTCHRSTPSSDFSRRRKMYSRRQPNRGRSPASTSQWSQRLSEASDQWRRLVAATVGIEASERPFATK